MSDARYLEIVRLSAGEDEGEAHFTPEGRLLFQGWLASEYRFDATAALVDLDELGRRFGETHFDIWSVPNSALLEAAAERGAIVDDDGSGIRAWRRAGLDISFEPAKAEWIVPGIIPRRAVLLFVAERSSLKTWFLLRLLKAAAYGDTWLGRNVPQATGPCALLDYENGQSEVDRRLALLGDVYGRIGRRSSPPNSVVDLECWRRLEVSCPRPFLIGIDTISRGSPGIDENDTRFAESLAHASKLANQYGTTSIFLHHPAKGGEKEPRGTGALTGSADGSFYFERVASPNPREERARISIVKPLRMTGDQPKPFVVSLSDARGLELVVDRALSRAAGALARCARGRWPQAGRTGRKSRQNSGRSRD